MAHTLTQHTFIPGRIQDVFAFFKDPYNLEAITPSSLRFRILACSDQTVREGTRIQYALRLHGVPVRWESLIREYRENASFADEQLRGPYALWFHRHLFSEVPGGVRMVDEVRYRLPLGPLGKLVHALAVRRELTGIFTHRATVIAARLGGQGEAPVFGEAP